MTTFIVDLTADPNDDTVSVTIDGRRHKFSLREAAHAVAELGVAVALKAEQRHEAPQARTRTPKPTPVPDGQLTLAWTRMGNGSSSYMALTPEGEAARVYRDDDGGWKAELNGQQIEPTKLRKRDAQRLIEQLVSV